jgi:glycerophosphoryl diester phosphodiesterase
VVPELVAHRGHAAAYPENTRSAVESALALGARCVEIDVQISADGRAVLFHDRSLTRMCGVGGAVHEMSIRALRALACAERGRFGERHADERILELADFAALLARHPRAFAFVEIKRVALEQHGTSKVLEAVLSDLAPVLEHCALISFDLPCLAAVRARGGVPVGAVFDRWEERATPLLGELRPEFLFFDLDGLPAQGSLRVPGSRVAIYEVADPAVARALAARGAEFVETFEIGRLLAAFARESP